MHALRLNRALPKSAWIVLQTTWRQEGKSNVFAIFLQSTPRCPRLRSYVSSAWPPILHLQVLSKQLLRYPAQIHGS